MKNINKNENNLNSLLNQSKTLDEAKNTHNNANYYHHP